MSSRSRPSLVKASQQPERTKRLVADVPEHVHRQVRILCLQRGMLVRDYFLQLLAKEGIE